MATATIVRAANSTDDNPFVRDNRQRRTRRTRSEETADSDETEESVNNAGGLDPQALPPAIGDTGSDDAPAEKPKRTRRPRKPKASETAESDDSDMQQAVNG